MWFFQKELVYILTFHIASYGHI
ncbi:putative membrane protein, partial [Vibrio parahaemolyticus 970107]